MAKRKRSYDFNDALGIGIAGISTIGQINILSGVGSAFASNTPLSEKLSAGVGGIVGSALLGTTTRFALRTVKKKRKSYFGFY